MDRDEAHQFAVDLLRGARNRESRQSREHGTDAELQVITQKAREIQREASWVDVEVSIPDDSGNSDEGPRQSKDLSRGSDNK